MKISRNDWNKYISKLRKINNTAAEKIEDYINKHGLSDTKELIDYSYAIVRKYGEASATLSARMYDIIAQMSGKRVPEAELADIADYGEVAKTVNGTLKTSSNAKEIAFAVARWVKMASNDTTLKNGKRDKAEYAWIPNGAETCPYCISIASEGWEPFTDDPFDKGHADHIHSNCDCQYMVRFNENTDVVGYDPDKYKKMKADAEGSTLKDKISSMRREMYEEENDTE